MKRLGEFALNELSTYTILDDLLKEEELEKIQTFFTGNKFPWFYQKTVAGHKSKELELSIIDNFYFTHLLYDDGSHSLFSSIVEPILNQLNYTNLIRIKVNLYPKTFTIYEHPKHTDYEFSHSAAIFYVNTNDGFTVLEDDTKIQSIANRLLIFDGSTLHNSTTCTNEKSRININFNYI